MCIGYNSSTVQQHKLVLEAIKKLPQSIKSSIFVYLSMAYGETEKYKKRIQSILEDNDFESIILSNYLDDLGITYLRIATDSFINAQTEDAL